MGRWGEPPSATFQEPPSNACDFSGDRRGIFLIKGVRRMLAGPWRPISLSSLCPVPCWHCCHVPSPGVPRKQWPRPACAGPGLTPLGAGGGGGSQLGDDEEKTPNAPQRADSEHPRRPAPGAEAGQWLCRARTRLLHGHGLSSPHPTFLHSQVRTRFVLVSAPLCSQAAGHQMCCRLLGPSTAGWGQGCGKGAARPQITLRPGATPHLVVAGWAQLPSVSGRGSCHRCTWLRGPGSGGWLSHPGGVRGAAWGSCPLLRPRG